MTGRRTSTIFLNRNHIDEGDAEASYYDEGLLNVRAFRSYIIRRTALGFRAEIEPGEMFAVDICKERKSCY